MIPAPAVYRAFDADGRLIYVGSSIDPLRRVAAFYQRHTDRDIVRSVVRIEIEHCDTIGEAREREAQAIFDEQPLLNALNKTRIGARRHWTDPEYIGATA